MANTKAVQYLNKDFDSLKAQLINFAKTYYPNTYNDFSEASPGMMLIEMASYVGDILSFYTDNQIQENFLQFAKQRKNLLALAYNFGYRPKVTSASSVEVSVYQVVPSIVVNNQYVPDFNYALILEEGTQLQARINGNVSFYINEKVDFSNSGSSPIDISVYSSTLPPPNANPQFYLLKKTAKATAGVLTTTTFTFGNPERFPTVTLTDTNVISIVSVVDEDNNQWYEVPYLAQDTIFEATENTATNDPNLYQYSDTTPYLLKLKKVPRRFVSRFKTNNSLELQFGPGVSSGADEEIIPNPDNIGLGLPYGVDKMMTAWDPSNFLYTQTYGLAPSNTTLTVTYLKGGGATSNIPSNTLTNRIGGTNTFAGSGLDPSLQTTVLNSLAFTNEVAAVGGGDGDTNEEIRQNSLAMYPTQLRTITEDDYIIRTLSLPSKYGLISKAFITQDMGISVNYPTDLLATQNPNALSLYVLSRNTTGNLTVSNQALKQNLKTFLSEYRMLTDAVNIKDAFIINIGVNFDVIVRPNYNNKLVINNCLNVLQSYFDIDKWQINQPIIISDIYSNLDQVDGVQTVQKVEIVNKAGTNSGYSQYAYDIKGATINNILYPSLDPSIFEVKNLTTDIQGRVVTF
jgi:hypothetical protein